MGTEVIYPLQSQRQLSTNSGIISPPNFDTVSCINESDPLIYTFKALIKKYKKHMGETNAHVVSGGLQQYLNKQQQKINKVEDGSTSDNVPSFNSLPVNIKLKIFSNMDAVELCRISIVCQDWYILTSDNLLWHNMLQRDIYSWNVIGYNTNPALYSEVQSEWTKKQIYLRCSPQINHLVHQTNTILNSLTSMIRYFLPKKIPKITMFGPGIESDTSRIVRKMLYENTHLLERVGLVPGQFDGVGSGWCLKMQSGQVFQLSVLYSAMKKVREERRNRLINNSLVELKTDEGGNETVELKPAVRDFCRTVDAFIYVVDASQGNELVKEDKAELFAMVNERWSATHVPVLVMSCVPNKEQKRVPCIDIVESLEISKMNRPWQVHDCTVEGFSGVLPSIKWLVEQSQRR